MTRTKFFARTVTITISILFIFYGYFNNNHMYGWVSALISLIILLLYYFLIKKSSLFLNLWLLYHFMFLISVFVTDKVLIYNGNKVSHDIAPYVVLPVLCFMLALPLLFISKPNLNFINNKITDYLCYIFFPLIIFSIIYLLPYTFNTFIYGAAAVRTGGQNSEYWSNLPSSILTTLSVGISMLYPLYIFLFFYSISFNKNKVIFLSMLCGIVCGLVGGLVFATRDRFVYVLMFLLFNMWLWKPFLYKNIFYIKLKKYIYFSVFIFAILFIWITLDRFEGNYMNILSGNFFYYGVQPYIFSEVVTYFSNYYGLAYSFPIFFESVNYMQRTDAMFWTWGTIFQNFYIMGGWLFCFLFLFIYNFIWFILKIFIKKGSWLMLIMLILYYQIVSQGIFYFNLGFKGGNLYIVSMLFIGILMSFLNLKKHIR